MSTPTTENVRAAWAYFRNVAQDDTAYPEALAQFDRWLAEVKAEAWDEGRASLVLDSLTPLREDGTRLISTSNPHRTP